MSDSDLDREENPKKKVKQMVKFNPDWKKYEWIRQSGDHFVSCILCNNMKFSIGHGGENDIKKHMRTNGHILNLKSSSNSRKLSSFFTSKCSKEEECVIAAEVAFCYHTVKHSHSYASSDCASSLFACLFTDSNIASKYSCGRTKIGKIISNVLAPASKKIILDDLKNDQPFSVSTDASNKGNIKTFPLVLRYFGKEKGVQTVLLSFYSLESERSVDIANSLKLKLENNGLNLKFLTSFCADNAPVNFGKHQSVFTELKKDNSEIIAIGCPLHILHNVGKWAARKLKIDAETVCIKVYNEFSSSTKKAASLKEFFDWMDMEWSDMLRHIPTRWLSLLPAIERLIKNYEPIKSYFLSQDSLSPILHNFFNDDNLGLAYLGFVMNTCSIFQPALKKLQGNEVLITELYDIMNQVRQSLINRKKEQFYGSIARGELQKCINHDNVKKFKVEANDFLTVAIEYIQKCFNFEDNNLLLLDKLTLKDNVEFSSIENIVQNFKISSIDTDILFEEIFKLNAFIDNEKGIDSETPCDVKWVKFFKNQPDANNLFKIVSYIFSIPYGNAISKTNF